MKAVYRYRRRSRTWELGEQADTVLYNHGSRKGREVKRANR